MNVRYTITVLPSELELWLQVKTPNTYKPRFNAAPGQTLPIITNDNPREVIMSFWGFKSGSEETSHEKETIQSTQSLSIVQSRDDWKKLLHTHRCLILADGFYGWKKIGKSKKIPYRIVTRGKKLICFAGLWKSNIDKEEDSISTSFLVITRPSYKPVDEICEVMPLIVEPGNEMRWLTNKQPDLEKVLHWMEIEDWALLRYYPVRPSLENTEIDNPDLIKPVPPSDQHGNLTLFD